MLLLKQENKKSGVFVTAGVVFLSSGFKFQTNFCNRCHNLLVMSITLSDIAILNIISCDYVCIISGVRISEAINLIKDIDLTEKSRTL